MGALGHDSIETIIAAKSFVIRFYLADQIDSLVEVIPTDLVYKADPINKTDADLGPKFGSRFRFPSLDGANMRLADADDTLAIMLLHPLLLTKHFRDHQKILVGALAIGAWFVRNVNDLFAFCTGFVEQRDIGWAGDIRRRTRGSDQQFALVAPGYGWIVWFFRRRVLFTNLLGNRIVDLGQYIRGKTFSKMHHHRWVERWLGHKGFESAKVLQIRIFGNLFHAGPIADRQFFLDNQGRHPEGQRRIANPTIRKGLYTGRFELLPRDQFGKLNPFVVGR